MTPLISAVASLVLAVAIVIAFAAYLRHYLGRGNTGAVGTAGAGASSGFDIADDAARCGNAAR